MTNRQLAAFFTVVVLLIGGLIATGIYLPRYLSEQSHQRSLEHQRAFFNDRVDEIKAGKNFRLQLYDLENTDDLLKCIEGLPGLTHLWLDQTDVTDAGLASVATLPDLKMLFFRYVGVTDAGLRQLENPNLSEVHVGFGPSTSFSMAGVVAIPTLRHLRINTDLQDLPDGFLEELGYSDQLETLTFVASDKSEPLIVQISQLLPTCKVILTTDRDRSLDRTFLNGDEV